MDEKCNSTNRISTGRSPPALLPVFTDHVLRLWKQTRNISDVRGKTKHPAKLGQNSRTCYNTRHGRCFVPEPFVTVKQGATALTTALSSRGSKRCLNMANRGRECGEANADSIARSFTMSDTARHTCHLGGSTLPAMLSLCLLGLCRKHHLQASDWQETGLRCPAGWAVVKLQLADREWMRAEPGTQLRRETTGH
ncbi:hypothetical protein RRG08_038080 [Elysia crispata]|uniref:Uncharacterized protein n=1 Tax=Elysia crispata TaxID=231223 RepID=A0AAE0ZYX6_9GAST|nr:hypothetical protein RRG08_038080 [Elysia crispata]